MSAWSSRHVVTAARWLSLFCDPEHFRQPSDSDIPLMDSPLDIVEAFVLAAYLKENASRQYMAMQIGEPYVFSESEQQACREKLWSASLFKKTWYHYYSKLR